MAATHQLKIQDLFSVKGYVCVVTGGGTGIGLMATQTLAANGESTGTLLSISTSQGKGKKENRDNRASG